MSIGEGYVTMDLYTVAFFGHRQLDTIISVEKKIKELATKLLARNEYTVFQVGRQGVFDQAVSCAIRSVKKTFRNDNSSLTLVLPYETAEYRENQSSFRQYYDDIEIYPEKAYFKRAILLRNRYMVDRADLVVVYVERTTGGAYQALQYAQKQGKTVINLADSNLTLS